ncbi:PQQ-dependent sugar dehydrogenase [Bythopirellula goksoeyrii]|uniref:Quinoprotein glucose dehydrogenase B n=1 Tax=Bythopirellula goksoeyrii TaxID=1400387 RepID=A0A5B9QFK6_9BACT|nr:PQQ-dependent sugar dehydrogenase [Bythopirellula goksoeyrii]QEG36415.1 Quinoprotein glucose dehydrogenase B precursor [Bythopirellula goksoeyrii]
MNRKTMSLYCRRLQMESLEPRCLLAGDTYLVNFQFDEVLTPTRYIRDVGAVYSNQGGGLTYGWSSDHTDVSRDRGINADQRLDTLIHFHQNQKWEFGLPNGTYEVTVSVGDPEFASSYTLNVEGVNFWSNLALGMNDFREQIQQITIADGRLTIDQGSAAEKATRINFVHIVGLPSGPNSSPSVPSITEPGVPGQVLNPTDVHMESVGFFDVDGNLHKSSDWEIWQTDVSPQIVWQTLGIQGVERLHTHLGDGVFINSHAGRTDLLPNANFELRVRFRDDDGSVSSYAMRNFQTGSASATFPLELADVANSPVPSWSDADTPVSVILPAASPNQSELRVESQAGELLLKFMGNNGISNTMINPAELSEHVNVRVAIVAGSNGLMLESSNLDFSDDHGGPHTIFLPEINLTANHRLDLWVSSDGSTYYGSAGQTSPDFSNLARASETSVEVPFTAFQPGYVVEEVAGGLQLPTNIAFVPNPGPNPGDPYFYVTELYGTIKVVTRDFSVSDYATNLLNFNPTGSFPGSGEQGLTGIVVDPVSEDVFVSRVTATNPADPNGAHHPQVVRFTSSDGGLTASSSTVIRDMIGESQGQSHQISNLTIGPDDGLLYVHNGDGFDAGTALNLDSYRGKILRMNLDGTAPTDNPFYNAGNGINARDYVYAYGVRNPFGGAWRAADGEHYEVENGPSTDRFARILRGQSYGWNGSDASMSINAIYTWVPAHAPVNITFVQNETFGGSQFPPDMRDRAYVSESGPTYALGPQTRGKRIVEFNVDTDGNLIDGPTTLVGYTGNGRATVVGLIAGPDGLYFTELYKDLDAATPIEAGARVFRVRYVAQQPGDYDYDGDVDGRDFLQWQRSFGSTSDLSADGDRSRIVEGNDLGIWQSAYGSGPLSTSVVDMLPAAMATDPLSGCSDSLSPAVIANLASEGIPASLNGASVTGFESPSTTPDERSDQIEAVEHALEQLYAPNLSSNQLAEVASPIVQESDDSTSDTTWDDVWGNDLETKL